jgi:glucosamine kinase
MNTILIADSGSTKTDWILVSPKKESKEWTSQGLNPFFQSKMAMEHILENEVFPQLRVEPHKIYFYGAGCANAQSSQPVREALQKRYQNAKIEVASDLLGAARSLCQQNAGIACILGTGSNNGLYDGSEITSNIGSLGFWMGDEGSGGYLGKQLIIAYLHKELPSDLEGIFHQAFPTLTRMKVLERAYQEAFPNRYFATFAPFVREYIAHPYLIGLVKQGFQLFLRIYVLKHPCATHYTVSFTGSVALAFQDILIDTLLENDLVPGSIIQRPIEGLVQFHTERDVQ